MAEECRDWGEEKGGRGDHAGGLGEPGGWTRRAGAHHQGQELWLRSQQDRRAVFVPVSTHSRNGLAAAAPAAAPGVGVSESWGPCPCGWHLITTQKCTSQQEGCQQELPLASVARLGITPSFCMNTGDPLHPAPSACMCMWLGGCGSLMAWDQGWVHRQQGARCSERCAMHCAVPGVCPSSCPCVCVCCC